MLTTVTLDDDVARALQRVAVERGLSLSAAVNDVLRAGLRGGAPPRAYEVPSRPMGARPGLDLDHALAVAGELEGEPAMRELRRGDPPT